ncbi:MAG: sensor histidine kinase [Chitinophagaceae bacterium]|nr:sensor histidine kinase [Chitinophagaceae bacterium]
MEEQVITIALLSSLLLVIVIASFYYFVNKQHKKIIEWQEARVNAEIVTLESERKKIATDLHDDIGPLLSSIKMQLSVIDTNDETDFNIITKSKSQIDEVITKFRIIATNLLPNSLLRDGLNTAIKNFIERVNHTSLKIKFESNANSLNEHFQVNIYRIIQEIIHNTIKHAKANFLTITILQKKDSIIINTTDDGIGFIFQNIADIKTIGMLSLQSRVSLLNGKLNIESELGKGTKFIIHLPLTDLINTNGKN